MKVLVGQLCLTLCDPMDCSSKAPLSMGILQARILEWVAIPFFRGSSWLGLNPCLLNCRQADSLPSETPGKRWKKIFLWVIKNSIDLHLWFSYRIFIVSGLVFRSLKHFEFIFVYGVRKCSNFILLHIFGGDLFTKSCPTRDPMDCSPSGSSVYEIF